MIDGADKGGATRRAALAQVASMAVLPLVALATPAPARAGPGAGPGPGRAMSLRRELVRGLADGQRLVVVREWRCDFVASADGLRIDGTQTAVAVDAPAMLAGLADLERRREVTTLFPALLDAGGRIVGAGTPAQGPELARAADTARSLLERLPAYAGEGDAGQFVRTLVATAATVVSTVPRDLFYPLAIDQRDTRDIALDGGKVGQITIAVNVAAREEDGLLRSSERGVETRFEGDVRLSSERWTLDEIA